MEASLSLGDWVTNVAYFSVVSICAPIWEEVGLWAGSTCTRQHAHVLRACLCQLL